MTTPGEAREAVLAALVGWITAIDCDHPLRVGIDGKSTAGKTTLAAELAGALRDAGLFVVQASIDHFHPPGHRDRSASGGYTAESYYEDGFQYALFRELVLDPLQPGGSRRIRPRLWDSYRDEPFSEEWVTVPEAGVLVVDGACLFRPEFDGCWEFTAWLDIDNETIVERARGRDVRWMPDAGEVERRYVERWIPLHEMYERLTGAPERADVVIDNRNVDRPVVVRAPTG